MYKFAALTIICTAISFAQTGQPKPTPSTHIPVTQNRDHAVYDWQQRHKSVLELGKTKGPVDIAVIGDSIIHYWAGEPVAPRARGATSWAELFGQKNVANLGFGWDRVENVLWRVENGQLDTLKPKTILLLIGTNNIELNTPTEIATGIQKLCKTIQKKLPDTTIHVLGILPRNLPEKHLATPAQINSILHDKLSGGTKLHFHDISHIFLDEEQKLKSTLFSDGLHPNEKGYAVLAAQLLQIIK